MELDAQKINTIYNLLKDLVGAQGAFTLFCAASGGETAEDTQIRTFGSSTRVIGLLDTCVPFAREHVIQEFNKRMQKLPPEPD